MKRPEPIKVFKTLFLGSLLVQCFYLYKSYTTRSRDPASTGYLNGRLEVKIGESEVNASFETGELVCTWTQTKKVFSDGTYKDDNRVKSVEKLPLKTFENKGKRYIASVEKTYRGPSFFKGNIDCVIKSTEKTYKVASNQNCGLSGCFSRPNFNQLNL